MKTIFGILFGVLFLALLSIGCDQAKPKPNPEANTGSANSNQATDSSKTEANHHSVFDPATHAAPASNVFQAAIDATSQQPAFTEPETERVKADVGVGKKGHYGQKGGDGNIAESATDMITVPVATLFRAKEMAAYRIQVPQALQLFKAMNDGNGPKTHEEFMEKIIKANNIPLPELPDGQKYVYDPEKEELMVEKPRQ